MQIRVAQFAPEQWLTFTGIITDNNYFTWLGELSRKGTDSCKG